MNWEQKAIAACAERDLEVLGFEGVWVFVRDTDGFPYTISEEIVANWIGDK